MFSKETFVKDLGELGVSGDGVCEAFEELDAVYGGSDRHYHNREHISDCLTKFTELRGLAAHPAEVVCAIWFHDAVYDSRRSDNEAQSAVWAERFMRGHGLEAERIERVRELILATQTHRTTTPDSALMLDVDLSILGADPDRFAVYDEAIRREYAWVPETEYVPARARILRGFLERPAIFLTELMHARYEISARRNLTAALG